MNGNFDTVNGFHSLKEITAHQKAKKEYDRKRYANPKFKEKCKAYCRKRYLDPEYRKKHNAQKRKRYTNPIYRETRKTYIRNQRKTLEVKAAMKEYQRIQRATNPVYMERKRKAYARRQRELGFFPINNWFKNSHAHHINKDQVIYIPKELHLAHYGHRLDKPETMYEINRLSFQYLTDTVKQL